MKILTSLSPNSSITRSNSQMPNNSIPIIGLIIAVFVLIFLSMRTKVHPLIAMIFAACIAGLTRVLSLTATMEAITKGFGSTLGTIGIVIGLGVMMGRILEVSGAAERIAYSFIKWLGNRREEWALAMTGYLVSIPIFADSAFVLLFPIAKALSKKRQSFLANPWSGIGRRARSYTYAGSANPGPLGCSWFIWDRCRHYDAFRNGVSYSLHHCFCVVCAMAGKKISRIFRSNYRRNKQNDLRQ